jgi:hypothetical protein
VAPPTGEATQQSEFDLLGNAESVIDLDPEVADGGLQLRMPQQQLDRSQVAGFSIDLGAFVRRIEWVP